MQAVQISAVAGINAGFDRMNQSAQTLSNMNTDDGPSDSGIAEAAVGLTQAKVQVQASAAVLRTADEMTGALLDIMA